MLNMLNGFIRPNRQTNRLTPIMTAMCISLQFGCASSPGSISPARVAVDPYLKMECGSLVAERARVDASLKDAVQIQAEQSTHDAVTVAAAITIVTPLVAAIRGDRAMAAEVARLKGERIAIDTAIESKRCRD